MGLGVQGLGKMGVVKTYIRKNGSGLLVGNRRISGLVNLMQVDLILFYADNEATSSFNILKIKCLNHESFFFNCL